MKRHYIHRQILEREKYYQFGDYFSLFKQSFLDLYTLITNRTKRIVLLADAGHGKTTELKMVTRRFIEEKNPNFIPIFVELNTYDDRDMEDYVRLKIGEDSESLLTQDKSKLVFLFDEFDQVMNKGKAERRMRNCIEKYSKSTFIIACRTNFYSGQFEDFNILVLLPLNSNDIREYAQRVLNGGSNAFLQQLSKDSLFELAKNPFFLNHLVKIYRTDKKIPKNRVNVFSRIISLSLKKDEVRLASKYDLRQTYPASRIEKDSMYMSLIMETLQRNFVSIEEFNQIIPDTKKGQIIPELSLLKKSFSKQGDVYQFQHNNFQEYLAAKMIANESLDKVKDFISFTSEVDLPRLEKAASILRYIVKPLGIRVEKILSALISGLKHRRTNKINPSWVNTVAFLCQIRKEDDLLEYLMNNEPELTLKFELSRIDESTREKLFATIFEKYTRRKIWLDQDRIDFDEMANFGKTQTIYDYLIEFARSREHFMYRCNAIQMLSRMKGLADESLHSLLIQYARDEAENSNVRHISLYALAWLGWADQNTIENLKHLKDSNDELVLAGFYYLIKESSRIDNYVDLLLDGILHHRDSTLLDVGVNLMQGIQKVESTNGIKTIIKYYIEHPSELEDTYVKDLIEKIAKNAAKTYNGDNSLYNEMKKLIKIADKNHMEEVIPKILIFFRDTGTILRLFRETYNEDIESNYSLLACIADEQCIGFLIKEYREGRLSDGNIQIFINFLSSRNRDEFSRFLKMINQKTGKFLPPSPRDYEKERKEKLQRKIQIIFDKEEFLKEVERIFDGEGKKELACGDIEDILSKRWDEPQYDEFVSAELMNYFQRDKSKKWTLDNLKREINKWDYEPFMARHVFDLLYHGSNVQLSEAQNTAITDFCLKNLKGVDFRKALQPRQRGETAGRLVIILWYFLRKFDLPCPDEVLLDMLSFDWIENGEYVGIDYLERRLAYNKIEHRVLENLSKGIRVGQVLKNHINYSRKHKIEKAKKHLYQIIQDSKVEMENRLLALETVAEFANSAIFLERLLDSNELKLFVAAAKILMCQGNKKCKERLIQTLLSKNEEFALESAKLLIKEQNLKAIRFYADHIKRTKKFEVDFQHKNILQEVKTTKALSIIFDLLRFSYEYRKRIQQDKFDSLYGVIVNVLKNIALQSSSNFNKVSKELQKFIKKYRYRLEGINFLNALYDDIEKAFYTNYSTRLSVQEAIRRVKKFRTKI